MFIKKYAWFRYYAITAIKAFLFNNKASNNTLTFVIPNTAKGWILDTICKKLHEEYPGESKIFYHDGKSPLPESSDYFFIHYSQLFSILSKQPEAWKANRFVWYTHNSDEICGGKPLEIRYVLSCMKKIFTTNSQINKELLAQGVKYKKLYTLLGGADPRVFKPRQKKSKNVGLSMAFYERKNPQLIADIVKSMPDISFILVGKDWEKWEHFKDLKNCNNFTYYCTNYDQYPEIYANFNVFLSTSSLEGGPIPLVETMMCNIFPVVSDTGFARDLIDDGNNGIIFPVTASSHEITPLIRKALRSHVDVAKTVQHLSWINMSKELFNVVND